MSLYNQIQSQNTERLAALSDGIFAVAMTLLVLDLHVPSAVGVHSEWDLIQALRQMGPQILTYGMSFLTLGIFWAGQQTQLNHFERVNRDLSWIHLVFLAAITMMPFSTRFLAEFIQFRTALLLYWFNILVCGVALYASWSYAEHMGLVKADTPQEIRKAVCSRVSRAQGLYALGAALCVFSTYWSIGFIVAIQLNFALAPLMKRRVKPAA